MNDIASTCFAHLREVREITVWVALSTTLALSALSMERLGPFSSVAALARVYSLLIHIFLSHAEYDIKLRGPLYTLYFDFVSEFRHPKDDTKTPGRAYFATTITTCSIMLASRIVRNVGSTGNKLMNEPGNNRNLVRPFHY